MQVHSHSYGKDITENSNDVSLVLYFCHMSVVF